MNNDNPKEVLSQLGIQIDKDVAALYEGLKKQREMEQIQAIGDELLAWEKRYIKRCMTHGENRPNVRWEPIPQNRIKLDNYQEMRRQATRKVLRGEKESSGFAFGLFIGLTVSVVVWAGVAIAVYVAGNL